MSAPHIASVVTYAPVASTSEAEKISTVRRGKVVRPARAKKFALSQVNFKQYGTVLLLGLNVVLFGWYLVGVNNFAGLGYELGQARKQVMTATEAQRQLQVAVAEKSAAVRMQEQNFNSPDYVAMGTPEFVSVSKVTQVSMR